MKTLDEIIKRNDYVRMNKALVIRATELASIIRKKMEELDVVGIDNGIWIGRHYYFVRNLKSNIGEESILFTYSQSELGDEIHFNLEGRNGYLHGDYHCPLRDASNTLYRDFLNDAQAIVEWLDDYETQVVEKMEASIENAKAIRA